MVLNNGYKLSFQYNASIDSCSYCGIAHVFEEHANINLLDKYNKYYCNN